MNTKNKSFCALFALLLALLMPLLAFGEGADDQTLVINAGNTPIKGMIYLEKTGPQLNGVDASGNPIYETVNLKNAVFEIRAAEDIVGKDGTLWYRSGAIVSVITTSGMGDDHSPALPLGTYIVTETHAPDGYVLDQNQYTVTLTAEDQVTPVVAATVSSWNDPNEILLMKTDHKGAPLAGAVFGLFDRDGYQVAAAVSAEDGLVKFSLIPWGEYTIREISSPEGYLVNTTGTSVAVTDLWKNTGKPVATVKDQLKEMKFIKVDTAGKPMEGIRFALINAEDGQIAETSISDSNGVFTFTRFDYGNWIIRETNTPDGYCAMSDMNITVDDSWETPAPVMCVNIPNHYEFKKVNTESEPLAGVKFVLEDESGNVLRELTSDKEGIVRIDGLVPGTYFVRETKTLKKYTLSGDVRKIVVDQYYIIPDEMPQWVNYTVIQTGVNLVMTGVMWAGLIMMLVGSVTYVIRRKRSSEDVR